MRRGVGDFGLGIEALDDNLAWCSAVQRALASGIVGAVGAARYLSESTVRIDLDAERLVADAAIESHVILGEEASRIRTRPGMMARIRLVAPNILRANGVQNVGLALHANTVSFDQLLTLGMP